MKVSTSASVFASDTRRHRRYCVASRTPTQVLLVTFVILGSISIIRFLFSDMLDSIMPWVTQQQAQQHLQPSYKPQEIVEASCSQLPDSVRNLTFPLRTPHYSSSQSSSGSDAERTLALQQQPLLWIFDSGVKLRTQYLRDKQLKRFWTKPEVNLWETVDEPFIMEAVRSWYPQCIEKGPKHCVFVDGGAAYGYYSQMIRLHFPLIQVLAFNPHPVFCEQMLDNLALSHVHNVCLQQVALSDRRGTADMPYGVSGRLGGNGKTTVEVSVKTLDDYYDEFGKDKLVVFIKLDVEGFGGNVIRGAPKFMHAAKNVLVGLHNKLHNKDEMKACQGLESMGFQVNIPEHTKETPNGVCMAVKI